MENLQVALQSIRALGLIVVLLCVAHAAMAHPLGDFTISQYSRIRVGRDVIEVRYIVDMAEIPTFQELQEAGIEPKADDPLVLGYLARKAGSLKDGLLLAVNGRPLSLHADAKEIIFPPGAGGLPTLKIAVTYKAELKGERETAARFELHYRDRNFPDRAGWKEVIAIVAPGVALVESSVPALDRSRQLSDYPRDLLDNPPQDLEARVVFNLSIAMQPAVAMASTPVRAREPAATPNRADRAIQAPVRLATVGDGRDRPLPVEPIGAAPAPELLKNETASLRVNRPSTLRESFTELIVTERLEIGIIFIALAVAAGLGAFHALEPGHGKTLVAAYLVGSHGTVKHALLLGLIVTAAHTAGVYLVGGVTLYASQYIIPERLYPWLAVVSGILIAILGLVLLFRRFCVHERLGSHHYQHRHLPAHSREHRHHHDHAAHQREHGHDHGHIWPSHDKKPQASFRELLTLGISGGIVPCPAALVVLLSAVSLNRLGFGLLLIVAFSAGLAAVLISIGLLMVYARRFMSRFQGDGRLTTEWLPMTSAAFIFSFGIALTLQALQTVSL